MRCAICNKDSETVSVVDDCSECQEAIAECLAGYEPIPEEEPVLEPEFDIGC